jgi:preprotein translocase subunit SecD
MNLRQNWRVVVLSVLLVGSVVALFGPPSVVAGGAGGDSDGLTNLQYGIELEGGARIKAPIAGWTATGAGVDAENADQVETTIESELGVDEIDVEVSPGGPRARAAEGADSVEVFNRNVSRSEFVAAMETAGLNPDNATIRQGVTQQTRDAMIRTVRDRIDRGLSGGSARLAEDATGRRFVVTEAPGRELDALRDLIDRRGTVELLVYHEENGTYVNDTVLTQEMDFTPGDAERSQRTNVPQVPVSFDQGSDDAREFAERMAAAGVRGDVTCRVRDGFAVEKVQPGDVCLLTVFNGEVIDASGVEGGLGRSFADGSFVDDPTFVMRTGSMDEARDLSLALQSGRMPARLNFSAGQEFSLEPALAQTFRSNSAITGLFAVLAVSVAVYTRYRDARIAAPMVVTALSEVVLLLGFAAVVGYPLDLSVIAGFIAVIGTGVDDLVIIADEVMSDGGADSSRVFDSRFSKAFWVIGAAAATTILAMSPLAVLSLGQLQGFAIVTILGVLVGVLITRPAYGDILRALTTRN